MFPTQEIISEDNDSFATAMKSMDEDIMPPGPMPTDEFNNPPSGLGMFSCLPIELRSFIYELAFDNVYWIRCPRPKSFYEHWATPPGIWHREPSEFGFGPRISHDFDTDVNRLIVPRLHRLAALQQRTIGVVIDAHCWAATHDPLQLSRGDITAIEIKVVPPRLTDPAELMWIRRNAQEFMKHWNASGVGVKEWKVLFLECGQQPAWTFKYDTWRQIRRPYLHRFDRLISCIGKVLEVLHPERVAPRTNRITRMPKNCCAQYSTLLANGAFENTALSYAQRCIRCAKSESELELMACGAPGPTGRALQKDRFEHIRIYEERAIDLDFEWARSVRDYYGFEGRPPDIPRRTVEWGRRYDILDRLGWSPIELRKKAAPQDIGLETHSMRVANMDVSLGPESERERTAFIAARRLHLMNRMNDGELEEVKRQYASAAGEEGSS